MPMPGTYNPYGAVPDALRETRLTLRDIMSDYLNTKVEENKLKLGEARLGVEKAAVETQMKQHELANLRDIARQSQQDSQFQQSFGLDERKFSATSDIAREALEESKKMNLHKMGPEFELDKRKAEAEIEERKRREQRATQVHAERNRVDTIYNFAINNGYPVTREGLARLGLNPDQRVKASVAKEMAGRIEHALPHAETAAASERITTLKGELTAATKTGNQQEAARLKKLLDQTYNKATYWSLPPEGKLTADAEAKIIAQAVARGESYEDAAQGLIAIKSKLSDSRALLTKLQGGANWDDEIAKAHAAGPGFDEKIVRARNTIRPGESAKAYNIRIGEIDRALAAKDWVRAGQISGLTPAKPSLRSVAVAPPMLLDTITKSAADFATAVDADELARLRAEDAWQREEGARLVGDY